MKIVNFSLLALRKRFRLGILGLASVILIGLSGCSAEFDEPAIKQNLESSLVSSDPPKTSYGKMVHLMSDTAGEAIDIIGKYTDRY